MSVATTIRKTASKIASLTKDIIPSNTKIDTLNNKWILYFVLFVSIVDLFNFFTIGDTTAIAIFIVAGFLTTYFSKNMLVILIVSIVVTHIMRYGNASLEGMEGEAEEEEEEVDEGMEGEAQGEAQGEEEDVDEEGLHNPEPALSKITKSLDAIKKVHPDEIAIQTETLIDQTKKVQENMAMLEPYLKQAAKATEPLKSEGFCDYASAYKK